MLDALRRQGAPFVVRLHTEVPPGRYTLDPDMPGLYFLLDEPVTVKGVASVFEATVQWELLRGGSRVDGGVTTAAQSAPARAPYTFATKPLEPGDYVLRVFATSPQDGSTMAEQRVPFTAR